MSQKEPHHPLTTFSFKVSIQGFSAEAYFQSVGGIKSESEVVEYREGGINHGSIRLAGPSKWPNIVLKRGFAGPGCDELRKWREDWSADPAKPVTKNSPALVRKSGSITQLGPGGEEICRWSWKDGWPCKWEGPNFDATKSELAIETLEISHHGLVYEKLK